MKILLASSSSGSRGGGELYLLYLGEALQKRGHEIVLWASTHPRMDELAGSFRKMGCQVVRMDYRNMYDRKGRSISTCFNFTTSREIAACWKQIAPDCVHVNKQNLEDGLDLLRAARLCGIPTISTVHLTQTARYLGAKVAWARDLFSRRELLKYPGTFVTVLKQRRIELVDFLKKRKRVRMVPNGVPVFDLGELTMHNQIIRQTFKIGLSDFLFIAVGRMAQQKRPLLFLELAEKIHQKNPAARFLWIGDGPLAADWDYRVSQKQLLNIIQRVPWQHNVFPFLAAADAFLHVADYEGLPLALLEAMSAGLPCIITKNLLAEMAFLDSTNSIAAEDYIQNPPDAEALTARGLAARTLVEKEFSYGHMAEAYETLYREAIAGA